MHKFLKGFRFSAALVALSIALAACGNDTATVAPAATTASSTTAAMSATTGSATTAAMTGGTTMVMGTGTAAMSATTGSATTAAMTSGTTMAMTAGTTAAMTPGTAGAATGSGVQISVAGTNVTVQPGQGQTFNPSTPITITVWDSQSKGNQDALVKLADTFHQTHSNITIKWDNNNGAYNYGTILKALTAAATAGGLPNLATGYENWVPAFVDSKTILGFNQFISGPYGLTQAQLSDIQPAFLARGIFPQYNNETYLFPFGNSTPALYYNQDVLTKYGISAPPATWDDLVKDSQTIAKMSNNATVGLVFNPKTVSEMVAGMYSEGCKVYDYGTKTWYFTDPTCANHIQTYYDGVKGGYFSIVDPNGSNLDEAAFEQQKAAFYISSTSSRSYIDADLAKGTGGAKPFTWNAAVLPHAAGVTTPVSTLYGGGVLAFKGKSQDEDTATWEVAKFLASTPFTASWASQSGYAPATKSALTDAGYQAFVAKNPHNGIPAQLIQYATVSEPKIGPWQSVRDEFDNDVFALFQDSSGSITVKSTMQKIQDKATSLVK